MDPSLRQDDDALLSEAQTQVLDLDRLKSYFEYDETAREDENDAIKEGENPLLSIDLTNDDDAFEGGDAPYRVRRLQQVKVIKVNSKENNSSREAESKKKTNT